MAKAATLISTRVEESFKEQFIRAAELNRETPSEALRRLAEDYVKAARRRRIAEDAAEIRAGEDEADVLDWIAAHGAPGDGE